MDHSRSETDLDPALLPVVTAGPTDPGGTSRRQVLGLAVVAGAGLPLLAACGGGGDDTRTDAGSGDSAGSGGDSPAAAGSSAPAGPLVATADVPVKGGVILDQQKIVVTQPAQGTFKAFTAICTHMSCTVGSVKNNVISCPCHGSAYSAMNGSVENGPATRALREITVKVEGDQVVEA